MARRDQAKLKKVSTSLPFGIGTFEWEADDAERKAAWSLYVELVTRIGVQSLSLSEGVFRESLSSLYHLFDTTRNILKEAGPDIGLKAASVGSISLAVLNEGVRPFLTKWHYQLLSWEEKRPSDRSITEHESLWSEKEKLRAELVQLQSDLEKYVEALASIAGVENLKPTSSTRLTIKP